MSFFVIIRGPLGCGKSTIAQELSRKMKAQYFSMDMILEEYGLTKDKEEGYISQNNFKKANEIITPQAKGFLQKGKPVIVDGNFYWRSQIEDLISRFNFPCYVFTLKAPLEICVERDLTREKPHGEDAVRVVYKKSTEFTYGIVIDVNKPLHDCVEEILSYLSND